MEKNKKIILITIIAVIVIIAIVTLVIVLNKNSKIQKVSKTTTIYQDLKNKESYTFEAILNNKNKLEYLKSNNMSYVDTTTEGTETKYITREGNKYLIKDSIEKYYKYQNNETDLGKIENQFSKLKDLEYTEGKETIENKKYSYEEFDAFTDLVFKNFSESELKNAKTRLYYNGNKLAYIKTIIGDYEELLKITITDSVNSNLFEIPSNYQEG